MMARSRWLLVWLAACGPGTPATTDPAGSSSGMDSTGDAPTSTATTAASGCLDSLGTTGAPDDETGSGEPIACPPVPGQPCTTPVECGDTPCGSHVSLLDPHGCPRATCEDDADCGAGEACSIDGEFDLFLAGSIGCVDDGGVCTCTRVDDPVVGVCMPSTIVDDLAEHCDALTDAEACARFDIGWPRYCRWTPTRLFCEGACAAPADSAACIFFSNVGNGCSGDCPVGPDGYGYSRPRPGGSELFVNHSCGDEPTLWSHCILAPTAACDCVCGEA